MSSTTSVNNYDDNNSSDSSNSNEMIPNVDPSNYFRNISLAYFVEKPMQFITKCKIFREECLKHGNLEATYIEGVIQYFVEDKHGLGLFHLRRAHNLGYDAGTFLYGVLLLAMGNFRKGPKILGRLQWRQNRARSDYSLARVMRTLSNIPLNIMEDSYYMAMVNLSARTNCENKELDNHICDVCYYYKQLKEFVEFAMNHNN